MHLLLVVSMSSVRGGGGGGGGLYHIFRKFDFFSSPCHNFISSYLHYRNVIVISQIAFSNEFICNIMTRF